MGKAGRNEMKRVAANFLNGTAVAVVMTGCLGPLLIQSMPPYGAILSLTIGTVLHIVALRLVGGLED